VKIDVPLMQRNVLHEPLPANHDRMLALLEAENKKYFPNL